MHQALVSDHFSAHVVEKKEGLSVSAVSGMSLAQDSLYSYTEVLSYGSARSSRQDQ